MRKPFWRERKHTRQEDFEPQLSESQSEFVEETKSRGEKVVLEIVQSNLWNGRVIRKEL